MIKYTNFPAKYINSRSLKFILGMTMIIFWWMEVYLEKMDGTLHHASSASLVEYACQYEASASYGSKVIAHVKVDNRQTNK